MRCSSAGKEAAKWSYCHDLSVRPEPISGCQLWRQWRTRRRRRAALLALGVRPQLATNTAGSGRGPWYLARAKALSWGFRTPTSNRSALILYEIAKSPPLWVGTDSFAEPGETVRCFQR
jgi:hypothetical protein